MAIFPKAIYRLNTISIKIPMALFPEMKMPVLKFIQNGKGLQIAKTVLKKKRTKMNDSHFLIPNILQSYSNKHSVVLA